MKRVCHCGGCNECAARRYRLGKRRSKAVSQAAIEEAMERGEVPPKTSFDEWAARRRREW